jgi:Fibronectin type III domain
VITQSASAPAGLEHRLPRLARAIVLPLALAAMLSSVVDVQLARAEALLGSQTIGSNQDSDSPGEAEAFSTTAGTSGTVSSLTVYLDASSKATKVIAGLYSENAGHPGTLITQGSTTAPSAGAWNQITVPAAAVMAGTKYWIGVLGPVGTGEIQFRDTPSGSRSESSSQSNLTSLPTTWSAGPDWSNSPISAYASGSTQATAPAASIGVAATAGNSSATVTWTAPSNGGSPITSYTITPFIGTSAQTTTKLSGSPPGTSTTITGLKNGTTYTFEVSATNTIGTGPASAASNPVTPSAPTAPAAPSAPTATAGNTSATVAWTAPSNGGSPITSYTITPYVGSTAQTSTTITGSPPANSTTISGLTNGTTYTFTVNATNAVGSGPPSARSNALTPTATTAPQFVQQASAHKPAVSSLTVTPASNVTAGDRLIVEVGVWSASGASAASVSDSAGNHYTELLHFKAADGTEMSVWSAPLTAGSGTRPTLTVKPTTAADIGIALSEYSGLSNAEATVVDEMSHASGTTATAAAVASGPTAYTTAGNELAVGFYLDSGFEDKLTGGSAYTTRTNVSPAGDMEFATEDRIVPAGSEPNSTVSTGPDTSWLQATIVFKSSSPSPPTSPPAPTEVSATVGNGSATVQWSIPANGGSPITAYEITPYVGTTAQTPTTITGSPPASSATIAGLSNGTTYTFKVSATNAIGTGPASAPSNPATPTATPSDPVIDSSTPAITPVSNNVTSILSNSFSPPAASVVYAAVALDSEPSESNPHVASVTNSGSALTWHLEGKENHTGPGVGGFVEVWWAYNPTAQSNIALTISLAQPTKNVTPPIGALQVIVMTNAAADQSAAAWGAGWDTGSGGETPRAALTTTAPDSLVFAVANNWDSSETPTLPATQTTTIAGRTAVVLNPIDLDTYWVQVEKTPTALAAPVTMSDSAPLVRYHMLAWEVLAQ